MSMVDKISLGKHYFKIALLLRESIFLSSVLTNSEVWYRVTKAELEELESLDRSLLKRIFSVPDSTPTAALYLETGSMSIATTFKAIRVNYLHYLVKLPHKEMLSQFFNCQWPEESNFDSIRQLKMDLADFNLPTDLNWIRKKSVFSWKKLVKKRAKEFELRNVVEMTEERNKSKLKYLHYETLKLQEYLLNVK